MAFPKAKWGFKRSTQSKSPVRKLIEKLDKVFSEFIRLRDCNKQGVCLCVTCGRGFHWKGGDAGHYVQRDRLATRFNEKNVNAQCKYCNRFRGGEQYLHGKSIDKKYGEGTADFLMNLGKARGSKLNSLWLEVKLKEYRAKVKELKKRLLD